MPSSGTFTGRTLANRSSSLRMATLALSMLGHPSPARGGGGRPFQDDVAGLQFGQHVVGDGLHVGGAVLDGQAVDLL